MQDIYIDDQGNGFPLVLVHGFLGSSEMWILQKEFLRNHFRVISPALPGFGESHKVKSNDNINKMAQTILECLKEMDIEKFNLLGHSMGGMIVQEMAKISGDKINKLICYATGSIGDIPGRFESMDASRERLRKEGIKETVKRVPTKWFVDGDKAKYFYLCENATKQITEETADNALKAMKNWRGYENLKNINNNPTRNGLLKVLALMGADIEIKNVKNICNEESGDVLVRSSNLNGVDIPEDIIPNIIDEIPILSIAAAFAEGTTNIKNAKELRVKESDRINAMAEGLKKLNINHEVFDDGLSITGTNGFVDINEEINSFDDHRIAMSFLISGIRSKNGVRVKNCKNIETSFPHFKDTMNLLGMKINEKD